LLNDIEAQEHVGLVYDGADRVRQVMQISGINNIIYEINQDLTNGMIFVEVGEQKTILFADPNIRIRDILRYLNLNEHQFVLDVSNIAINNRRALDTEAREFDLSQATLI
jgi:sulfur carrier protein ThiS